MAAPAYFFQDIRRPFEPDRYRRFMMLALGWARQVDSRRPQRTSPARRFGASAASTALSIFSVVGACVTVTRGGRGTDSSPATRRTSAPASTKARAISMPIRPDERLVITRTGSSGSSVRPAVTTTRVPAKSGALPIGEGRAASAARHCSKMTGGSAIRPGPDVPQASSPSPGAMNRYPAAANCLTLAHDRRVLPHVRVHGRSENDPSVLHRLLRNREQQGREQVVGDTGGELADNVGGCRCHDHEVGRGREVNVLDADAARLTRDDRLGMTCVGRAFGKSSIATGWPVRARNDSGPTNLRADSVITVCTSQPALRNSRASSSALYAAMPPVTPSSTRRQRRRSSESGNGEVCRAISLFPFPFAYGERGPEFTSIGCGMNGIRLMGGSSKPSRASASMSASVIFAHLTWPLSVRSSAYS